MVEEHELQKEKIQEDYNDKYWDQRYTLVQPQIPSFLQKIGDKILSTGKEQRPGGSQNTLGAQISEAFRVSKVALLCYFYIFPILATACWSRRRCHSLTYALRRRCLSP